jgi:hypothetical protein
VGVPIGSRRLRFPQISSTQALDKRIGSDQADYDALYLIDVHGLITIPAIENVIASA